MPHVFSLFGVAASNNRFELPHTQRHAAVSTCKTGPTLSNAVHCLFKELCNCPSLHLPAGWSLRWDEARRELIRQEILHRRNQLVNEGTTRDRERDTGAPIPPMQNLRGKEMMLQTEDQLHRSRANVMQRSASKYMYSHRKGWNSSTSCSRPSVTEGLKQDTEELKTFVVSLEET